MRTLPLFLLVLGILSLTANPAIAHLRQPLTHRLARELLDGYNYFGKHPEQMIEFFDTYMK